MSDPSKGDKRWNNSGGLWLQGPNAPVRWKGQIQIDGTVYTLEGYGSDQQQSRSGKAPTIKLKAKIKEMY